MKYNINWWRTEFNSGEAEAISKAISSGHVSQGPIVLEFERQLAKYLDVPYVIATTSGSTALLMSLYASGVKSGDEIIIPNRSWIATAHAPLLLGAKVKLVDVEPNNRPVIDSRLIEQEITNKTKAIIPVHLCGRSANMSEINKIAERHNISVIEDAAQALGSSNKDGFLGTQSSMGCFSFSVAKVISTGQGGCVATKSEKAYKDLIAIRTQGIHDTINTKWDRPGFNFRFTDILAAIGLQQIKLLPNRIKKLKEIYLLYQQGLKNLSFIKLVPVNIKEGEVPVYIEVLCDYRDKLINYLKDNGIETRPFYPDLNRASYLNNNNSYPESEIFGNKGVYLPSGPEQNLSDINRVIDVIEGFDFE